MAKQKVYVDADGNKVSAGASNAAYVFNADDERLVKFQKARKEQARINAGKPAAAPEPAPEPVTTERVGAERGRGRGQ